MIAKLLLMVFGLFCLNSYAAGFTPKKVSSLESFNSLRLKQNQIGIFLDFKDKKGELSDMIEALNNYYQGDHINPNKSPRTGDDLVIIAKFFAKRDIKTLTKKTLLDVKDLEAIGNSVITNFETLGKGEVRFNSKVGAFITNLKSLNYLKVFDKNDIKNNNQLASTLKNLLGERTPDIVSYQESGDFSDFLNRSQIFTMYFNIKKNQTEIISYTLTNVRKNMNSFTRFAMFKKIEGDLIKIPSTSEKNGLKYQK